MEQASVNLSTRSLGCLQRSNRQKPSNLFNKLLKIIAQWIFFALLSTTTNTIVRYLFRTGALFPADSFPPFKLYRQKKKKRKKKENKYKAMWSESEKYTLVCPPRSREPRDELLHCTPTKIKRMKPSSCESRILELGEHVAPIALSWSNASNACAALITP